jgi:hypothetical protein
MPPAGVGRALSANVNSRPVNAINRFNNGPVVSSASMDNLLNQEVLFFQMASGQP